MVSSKKHLSTIAFMLVLLLPSMPILHAQQTANTCPALANFALSQLGTNCLNLNGNEMCYGFNQVEASFSNPVPEDYFTQPGDTATLSTLTSIRTTAPDYLAGEWGIAMLSVQANLPVASPDATAIMVLLGDIEVENAVLPENLLILPKAATNVTTVVDAQLYDSESDGEAIGQVAADTTMQADGISADGRWLRVYFDYETELSKRSTAWINLESLEPSTDISGLPEINSDSQSPMQSFNLLSGSNQSNCEQAILSSVYIQSPEGIETDLTINGAEIAISSSIILRLLPPDNRLQLIVLSGVVNLYPNSLDEMLLPAGYSSTICLVQSGDDNNFVVGSDCAWTEPQPLTQTELNEFLLLGLLPSNVLHFAASVPRLACSSAIGGAVCEFRYTDTSTTQKLEELCAAGRLSDSICQAVASGV
jgi:hypothetical protein